MQQELLPLFPLQLVLLPGVELPLHIFEERYKEMIGESIDGGTEFGIVLASEKGIVNTGCTAVVQRVVNRYDDGRLDIIARGRRRFEILLLNEEKNYLRGAVEYFDDEDPKAAPADATEKVRAGFEELKTLDPEETGEEMPESVPLSFRVARAVPDLNFRQTLLATRSEAERIVRLAEYLPALLARMRRTAEVRAIAPTNGHARHLGF